MAKILFVCLHRPDRSPSQRYRFEQYIPYLEEKGFDCTYSFLLNEKQDKAFYTKGKILAKTSILFQSILKRINDIRRTKQHDIVFVQRECLMLGTAFFEKIFAKKAKLVFDFDDSIWLQNISDANKRLEFLKNPDKTKSIIKVANLVIAGNQYLADYALKFNLNTVIIPTTIDTNIYQPVQKKKSDKICIGWTGSFSTIEHFKYRVDVLKRIKEKYQDKVYFKVIGDSSYKEEKLEVKGIMWKRETEVKDLEEVGIGIMPLPDTEWTRGKCGLKGLQYMGLSIPTIMSPVGVNTAIIQDGINGFLADDESEWFNKLSMLIESDELRKKLGEKGRETVVKKYSVEANKDLYVKHLQTLIYTK